MTTTSPLRTQIHAILGALGVAPSKDYDRAHEIVESELARVKVAATFASLRRGELILEATPQNAALLRYDLDVIADLLNAALPGAISSIRIRSRRFSSTSSPAPDGTA